MKEQSPHETFVHKVYQLVGDSHEVIGVYKDRNTEVEIRHNVCGESSFIKPSNFYRGRKCYICKPLYHQVIRKTHEAFLKEVYELVSEEYEVIDKYIDAHTKIRFRHNECGNIHRLSPDKFLSGVRCVHCSNDRNGKKRRKTHSQFLEEVFALVGKEYTILGKYIKKSKDIEVMHDCGFKYLVTPGAFLRGSRCPVCTSRARWDTKSFKEAVRRMCGEEYTVMGEYETTHKKIAIKHNLCGYNYMVPPKAFLEGNTCPNCDDRLYTTERFISRVEMLAGAEYTVIGEYTGADNPIKIVHNTCQHTYHVSPSNFFGGKRCPQCRESKGEARVREWLKHNKINYSSQYRLDDCRNIRPLPFDFSLNDTSNNTKMIIEYDGEHHFKPVQYGGISIKEAIENYNRTQLTDRIKNDYCVANGIPLVRIPYWEFDNIEKILDNIIMNEDNGIDGDSFFI